MSKTYTLVQASKILGVHRGTLVTWCRAQKIKSYKAPWEGKQKWLIPEEVVEEFKKEELKKKGVKKRAYNKKESYNNSPFACILRDCISRYIDKEKSYLSPKESLALIKIRLKGENFIWKDVFGEFSEQNLLKLPPEELHVIAQEIRFIKIEIREQVA